jgi:uncharacterized protein (TIRG00374 family)
MTGSSASADQAADASGAVPDDSLQRLNDEAAALTAKAPATAEATPGATPDRPVDLVKRPGSTLPAETRESSHVSVDEPLLAARVHRPSDLIRFLLGILGVAAVFALASIATSTTSGLQDDITSGVTKVPGFLTTVTGVVSTAAVLIVPLAFAVERLIKRDGLRVADGVLAAVLAHGISLAVDLWVVKAAPESITAALTVPIIGTTSVTDPVHGYLTPVIAYMTAVGMASRPRWRVALWTVVLLDSLSELISGHTTPLSIAATILLGLSVAYGTLYAVGTPNVRPTGEHLLAGLRKVGFAPLSAHRSSDGPEGTRRYLVIQDSASPLDVHVIDREQQATGFFYRLWRRLQLRTVAVRSSPQSLRQALEQEALIAYAANAAGAHSPKLIATSELGPDAVILVYERVEGRSLDTAAAAELTDAVIADAWTSVKALHDRRIAHRRLTAESLLVTRNGTICLINLAGGDIAAGELTLRMDLAQMLTTLALRVGPERAVASANAVLGSARTASALPLLQPVGLHRSTRIALKHYNRDRKAEVSAAREEQIKSGVKIEEALNGVPDAEDFLAQIRAQILEVVPEAPVHPARLQRLKPKTLITVIAGAFAAYLLLGQLIAHNPVTALSHANWLWVLAAAAASVVSYVGAAMSLTGFVPERLPFWRTFLAQVAGSFVKLVAPAAVGGVALNARFLQRANIRSGQAVASVGASQLAGLGMHIVLLLSFGFIAGTGNSSDIPSSRSVIAGLLIAAVLVLVAAAIPPLRRWLTSHVRNLFLGVIPRMLDLVRSPVKLVTGFGGIILVSLAFVACLDASIRAFGGSLPFATIAVIYLTGNAAGSAVPVPGGIGTIDAALIGLLSTLGGLSGTVAAPAVIVFRLMTFWLPVFPGWIAFSFLQRKQAL